MAQSEFISNTCIICASKKIHYDFSLQRFRVEECQNCGFMRLNPQPTDQELSESYSSNYFIHLENGQVSELKSRTADQYLALLETYVQKNLSGSLLEISCGYGDFLVKAALKGLSVTGVECSKQACEVAAAKVSPFSGQIICGEITNLADFKERFDYIVFADVLEHVRDPHAFLKNVHSLLNENGIVVIAVPSLDSFSARWMKNKWVEFKPEHLWYFSSNTLKRLLRSENYGEVSIRSAHSSPIAASNILAFAKKQAIKSMKKLSVVMAAFNEEQTIRSAIDRVLNKNIPDIDIELIVVESQSTDNTRELICQYENEHKTDRLKVIWQDTPKGKGNAIREGFKYVTGDYILIQDADDEYDIEDYDVLLEPLINNETDFVLGARHGGRAWKMRQFNGKPIMSHLLNLGHSFFAFLVNTLFSLRLKDPFTMYKVFRTECLNNINFECDRFDFDFELLIKLARHGYKPIEIPVNYRSRSFQEGKKIRMIRDPLTWFAVILKLRLQKK